MPFKTNSGCQSSHGAGIQSPHGVRGCVGGVLTNTVMTFLVTPDDQTLPTFNISLTGTAAILENELYWLTVRSHEVGEQGNAAFEGAEVNDIRFFKDHLHEVGAVTDQPFDDPDPEPGEAYNIVTGYLGEDFKALLNVFNTFINGANSPGSIAICKIEDCLVVSSSSITFFPDQFLAPDTKGMCKITAHDENYQGIGFNKALDPYVTSGRVDEWKDTVVTDNFNKVGEFVSGGFYAKYLGLNVWDYLHKDTDPKTVEPTATVEGKMVQKKMIIKGLNDGNSLQYLFIGGNFLWAFSDENKFQKIAGALTGGIQDIVPYEKGILFTANNFFVADVGILNGIIYFDGKTYRQIGLGETNEATIEHYTQAHGDLWGTGTSPDPTTEHLPFYIYNIAKDAWELYKVNLPKVKDATVTITNWGAGKLFEMPEDFIPTNPAIGGTDWEVDEITKPIYI